MEWLTTTNHDNNNDNDDDIGNFLEPFYFYATSPSFFSPPKATIDIKMVVNNKPIVDTEVVFDPKVVGHQSGNNDHNK